MSTKSTSETTPWGPGQQYLLGAANSAQGAYTANAGNVQNATNQITDLLPDMIKKYQAGNPVVNAATGYNTDVLNGKYLGQGNPYLQQQINNTNNDVTNGTQAALSLKGLTGGSSYADLISRNLAKNETNMRYNDYSNERNAMATAAGQAPGLAAADVIQVAPMMQALQASTTPSTMADQYAGSIGSLLAPYQKTTQKQSLLPSILQTIGTVGAGFAMSDRRLKTDIKRVGQTDGGLPVYTYRYKGDPTPLMGVMAQDVAEKQPQALGPEMGGYMSVYYGEVR